MKIKKILIIAPHPDDELIGCGGRIIKALKKKEKIKIVYLTSGAIKSEPRRKAELRKRAVTKIAMSLDIKKSSLLFLNYYERSLTEKVNISGLYKKLQKIVKNYNPDEIYVPAYEGGHIDHDIANFITSKLKNEFKIYEYQMYNNYFSFKKLIQIILREIIKLFSKKYFYWDESKFIPANTKGFRLDITKQELNQKRGLIKRYKELAEKPLDGKEPRKLVVPYKADLLRLLPKYNYMKAPHLRVLLPLNYELAFGINFNSFREAVDFINKNEK